MAVYRLSVDYTLADQVVGPSGKVAFVPTFKLGDSTGTAFGTVSNPIFISGGTSNPATIYTDQQVVTASAVALTAQALSNGVVLTAKDTNTGNVFIGFDNTVTTADDGSGKGYRLKPGQSSPGFGVTNASAIFIIGTLNDVIYVAGN